MRAVCTVLLLALTAPVSAQTPLTEAARRRQDAHPSVEFHFRQKTVKESPTGPREVTTACRLMFDGEKAVLETVRDEPASGSVHRWRAASDGERVTISLTVEADGKIDPAQSGGEIAPAKNGVCRDPKFLPLTLAARGLDPVHCPLPADGFTPAGTAQVRGRMCDEYTAKLNGVAVTAWFDPTAGQTLRRLRAGGTVIEVESSDTNPAGVWRPASWTVEQFDKSGQRTRMEEFTVEKVEVGKGYAAGEFNPGWPAGLRVIDHITQTGYVVEPDGSLRRELTWWEAAIRRLKEWGVFVVAFGVMVAGVAAIRAWRKRGRRNPAEPGA